MFVKEKTCNGTTQCYRKIRHTVPYYSTVCTYMIFRRSDISFGRGPAYGEMYCEHHTKALHGNITQRVGTLVLLEQDSQYNNPNLKEPCCFHRGCLLSVALRSSQFSVIKLFSKIPTYDILQHYIGVS